MADCEFCGSGNDVEAQDMGENRVMMLCASCRANINHGLMTDNRNLKDEMTRPDPFLRFYNACDDAYRDHMALATRIRMNRDTWMAFVRHWPRYYGYTDDEPRSLTHPSALTENIKGTRVSVEEDNSLPYGELLVTFNNPHNRPPNYTKLVVVMKGWER